MDKSKEIEKAFKEWERTSPNEFMTPLEGFYSFAEYYSESQNRHLQEINKDLRKQVKQWERVPSLKELKEENERLEKERELILQQARCWAGEAKTQRSTVNQVGSLLGGVADWGPIAKGVKERIGKIEQLQKEKEEMKQLLRGLRAYGMIHTVKGVKYPEGTHQELMDKAELLTNNPLNKEEGTRHESSKRARITN